MHLTKFAVHGKHYKSNISTQGIPKRAIYPLQNLVILRTHAFNSFKHMTTSQRPFTHIQEPIIGTSRDLTAPTPFQQKYHKMSD